MSAFPGSLGPPVRPTIGQKATDSSLWSTSELLSRTVVRPHYSGTMPEHSQPVAGRDEIVLVVPQIAIFRPGGDESPNLD